MVALKPTGARGSGGFSHPGFRPVWLQQRPLNQQVRQAGVPGGFSHPGFRPLWLKWWPLNQQVLQAQGDSVIRVLGPCGFNSGP